MLGDKICSLELKATRRVLLAITLAPQVL